MISPPAAFVVILVVLTITTVASLLKVCRDPAARAHAGSPWDSPPEEQPVRG